MKIPIPALFLLPLLPFWNADAAINPALIPSDARWVVHADLNSLRTSAIGKELIAIAERQQRQNPIGINLEKLFTTVGTATAYGTNFTDDPAKLDGTLVLQGTEDLRKIAESLVLQATVASPETTSESKDLPFTSYTIRPKQSGGKGTESVGLIVAFPPEPIVIVSKSKAQVLRAREVYRSRSGSAGVTGPLKALFPMSEDAMIFAASVVPPDADFTKDEPQARILKMTNAGAIAIGEKGTNTVAHALLVATSDDMADKVMKIVQGMTAMLSLTESTDKEVADFISSAAVSRDDRTVRLSLSYSSERLAQMIRSTQQRNIRVEANRRTDVQLVSGKPLAQWTATAEEGADPDDPSKVLVRTIDNVELKNGSVLLLGRRSNGGKNVRFSSVEITPASGGGAPLTFRPEYMMQVGAGQQQFQFPGADGTYTLKIGYQNDPLGKAAYAVGVRPTPPANSAPDSAVKAGASSK